MGRAPTGCPSQAADRCSSWVARPRSALSAYAHGRVPDSSSPGTTGQADTEHSVLDKWLSTKTAKLGVDLTFPPIQFKDSAGNPTGYQMELTEAMMADLGVTPQ